jgi:hypothetical protein
MRLDDVWLQTTLNTPNISGVWQIRLVPLFLLYTTADVSNKQTKFKKKKQKKTCQWTLTLTWLVGFQTNKRALSYLPNT